MGQSAAVAPAAPPEPPTPSTLIHSFTSVSSTWSMSQSVDGRTISVSSKDGKLSAEVDGKAVPDDRIIERHGSVRRDGRWTLPRRLELRTAWCDVMLDLTSAVRSGPELVIEMRVRGGNVELVLAPGMVVDANELAVRHSQLAISRDAGDNTPETLWVGLVGRMKHGRIETRWDAPGR